jgi:hypothetical protein
MLSAEPQRWCQTLWTGSRCLAVWLCLRSRDSDSIWIHIAEALAFRFRTSSEDLVAMARSTSEE